MRSAGLLVLLVPTLLASCGSPRVEEVPPVPDRPEVVPAATAADLEKWIRRSAGRDYPLYPGDEIEVSLKNHPEYTVQRTIPADGVVPLYGLTVEAADGEVRPVTVKAAGKRVPELETELARLYSRVVDPPYVTVKVISYAPKTIYVTGAVETPRDYRLPDDRRISLVQALTMAGWFKDDAVRDRVRILRVDPESGERTFLPPIDVARIVAEGAVETDIPLEPGDTITVESRESRSVFVFGQVKEPGEYPWSAGLTLSRLVTLAGGLDRFPKTWDIRVLRRSPGRPDRVFRVDLDAIYEEERPDFPLEAGDVVRVDERFI